LDESFASNLLLVFYTTTTERKQLEAVAKGLGLTFRRQNHERLGRYYSLGMRLFAALQVHPLSTLRTNCCRGANDLGLSLWMKEVFDNTPGSNSSLVGRTTIFEHDGNLMSLIEDDGMSAPITSFT
jgi:hypothetical protein